MTTPIATTAETAAKIKAGFDAMTLNESVLTTSTPGYQALTTDSLLAFCEAQMHDLDGQINTAMDQQKGTNERQSSVQNIESEIKNGQVTDSSGQVQTAQKASDGSYTSAPVVNAINAQIEQAKTQALADGDNTTYAALVGVQKTLNTDGGTTGGTDVTLSAGDIGSMTTALDSANSALTSGAQMSMISLQSLVSQRQTQLQLVTNMLSSLDDGEKAIATNVGH